MSNTFGRHFLQAVFDLAIEGRGHAHIKPAADEREPQRLRGHFGELYANAAQNALARLKNDAARLKLLFKLTPLRPEAIRVCAIRLGVVLKYTIAR